MHCYPPRLYLRLTNALSRQVRDARGRKRVSTSGLSVVALVTMDDDPALQTQSSCGQPHPTRGVGDCHVDVPASWFAADRDRVATWRLVASYSSAGAETVEAARTVRVDVVRQ